MRSVNLSDGTNETLVSNRDEKWKEFDRFEHIIGLSALSSRGLTTRLVV